MTIEITKGGQQYIRTVRNFEIFTWEGGNLFLLWTIMYWESLCQQVFLRVFWCWKDFLID